MNLRKTIVLATLAIAAFWATTLESKSASAQSISISKTYKVEVQYWFFDYEHYYWSTKLETSNDSDAQFLYGILLWAKETGQLNAVVPHSYWRYIAVDVRIRTVYKWNWIQPYQFGFEPKEF